MTTQLWNVYIDGDDENNYGGWLGAFSATSADAACRLALRKFPTLRSSEVYASLD